MNIVLFEDNLVDRLYPITLSRPAWSITCGAWRLVDLAASIAGSNPLSSRVRPLLQEVQQDYLPAAGDFDGLQKTLWLNSRLVPDAKLVGQLEQVMQSDGSLQANVNDQIAVAMTPAGVHWDGFSPLMSEETIHLDVRLFLDPHEIVREHVESMAGQLPFVLQQAGYRELQQGVFVRGDTQIHDQVVLDSRGGIVVIEDGVSIDPFAVIKGPVRIGRGTYIAPHTHLKGHVSIGEQCKVGGEVSKTVIESYSNKVHYGYLGSAYVGSWVNLGAGTTNSNLKNTYGTVRVEYESGKTDTGLQFFGCVLGDYTKTAINTSIYTGKILGVCSNVYGVVTTNVPSFANYARSFGEITEQPAEVMEVTQKRLFQRRGIEQQDRHRRLIQAMYQIESPKRELANQPLSL
jgi:glucose-1-phosphate thymidylyltransferase